MSGGTEETVGALAMNRKRAVWPWLLLLLLLILGGIWYWSNRGATTTVEKPSAVKNTTTNTPKKSETSSTSTTNKEALKSLFEMVLVEGSTFQMGCTSEQGDDCGGNEKPAHSVTVSSFQMAKTEVTQAQWQEIMGTNPSFFKKCGGDCPVENVSWNDVQDFLKKLNAKYPGKNYRLPTEAEWEFAARGGAKSKGYKYAGSNSIGEVAWYEDNGGKKTHAVAQKKPNELGLHDMCGNVYEWCSDRYGKAYYKESDGTKNPRGASSGSYRVLRGGGWYYYSELCRVAYRNSGNPNYLSDGSGFRIAYSTEKYPSTQ